jgi:asparagine synthase (glutamine-hydrolysing)
MSIQAGILNFDDVLADRQFLETISKDTAEFGPDGESIHLGKDFGVLYRPRHATAESRREKQPFVTRSGQVLTWTGRLDNRPELLSELGKSHCDSTACDVEIIGAAFDQWGTDSFRRILGDWALSIIEPTTKTAILARDCFGVAPLFYVRGSCQLKWSSHLGPLVLSCDCLHLSKEFIAGYLAFHPDAHLTPFCDILSVPPGTFLVIDRRSIHSYTFWKLDPSMRTRHNSDAEYEEHFRFLLHQSVRRRLRTDSPILAGLSGGYDSTSILCMADDIMAKEGSECPRVDTFSYYDSREPDDDDLVHIRSVESKRRRTGIHCDMAGSGDSLPLNLVDFSPSPGFGLREEITPVLSAAIQKGGYRVGLSGTGGDEINGQPLDLRIQMADLFLQGRVKEVAAQLISWSLLTRRPWLHLFFGSAVELLPTALRARIVERAQVEPWMNTHFARTYQIARRQLEEVGQGWFIKPAFRDALQTLYSLSGQITHTPPSLIEQRYPYLDRTLVEFMTSVPLEQLLRPGERRSLMRRSLSDLLPAETATRKTKAAAVRCYCVTLEKHWDLVSETFRSPLVSDFGICDAARLRQALFEMRNGQVSPYFTRLLKALALELWLRDVTRRRILSSPCRGAERRQRLAISGAMSR